MNRTEIPGGAAPTVICTLGMHRSGTSLVARILNLLGVHLGAPQAVSGIGDDNPTGYWEHHPLSLLNDEILVRFGGRWDVPPVFPPDWVRDDSLGEIREKARRILHDAFATEPLWGWKDPRTCLTTPFWRDLIGPMRYVLCVHNPHAVAASLERRNHMLVQHADRLWLAYVAASLRHTSGQPRLLVFYEDVMADWPREVQRLASFIGRPDRANDPAVKASIADFIQHELHHHRPSPDDMAADQQLSFETKSVYLALRTQHGGPDGPRSVDVLAAQALDAAVRLDTFHVAHAAIVADRASQAQAVGHLTAARNELLAAVAGLTAERDDLGASVAALTTAQSTLSAERDNLARERGVLAAERDQLAARASALAAEAQPRRAELGEVNRQLEEIRGSSAWTLVLLLRRAINATLPVGTRRRRVFASMIHGIAGRLRPNRPGRAGADSRAC